MTPKQEKLIESYIRKQVRKSLNELTTLDNGIRDEIVNSVKMGFTTVQVGLISPKKKGVMLMNSKYQVRGVYPLEYLQIIQSIVDQNK